MRQLHPLNTTKLCAGDCSDSILMTLKELANKIIYNPGGAKYVRVQHDMSHWAFCLKWMGLDWIQNHFSVLSILFIWLNFPLLHVVATTTAQADKAHWKCAKYCCYPITMTPLASQQAV